VLDLSAVTLFIDDLATAKRFYEQAFSLPVHFEGPESVVFRFGSTLVNLLVASAAAELLEPASAGPSGAPPRSVLTLDVDDVDAFCARLGDAGIELLNGPVDRPWGVRTASFRDPDGHVWEIARSLEREGE
jgi:catechol 2,3-dioxygenase-like lactoylglutathione lyase family enzyme